MMIRGRAPQNMYILFFFLQVSVKKREFLLSELLTKRVKFSLILREKLNSVTEMCSFCDRNILFLLQILIVSVFQNATETLRRPKYTCFILYALFQDLTFSDIWEFLLSWKIKIITLWSPDQRCVR